MKGQMMTRHSMAECSGIVARRRVGVMLGHLAVGQSEGPVGGAAGMDPRGWRNQPEGCGIDDGALLVALAPAGPEGCRRSISRRVLSRQMSPLPSSSRFIRYILTDHMYLGRNPCPWTSPLCIGSDPAEMPFFSRSSQKSDRNDRPERVSASVSKIDRHVHWWKPGR